MKKVLLYSMLLLMGLVVSQVLPSILGEVQDTLATGIRFLTMTGLAFIMIHVGFEFHMDKSNPRKYGWDYVVAFTAASFPWIFVSLYFLFVMLPPGEWSNFSAWKETLLAGRFAAPTSAGVLFSMLVAAGLGGTWLFRKARILAIFDDLDTVLLMIPLKMLMVGIAWQLGLILVVMATFLSMAYFFLHRVVIPVAWGWVVAYALLIAGASEALYAWSTLVDPSVPIHIEVLLPAFVVGCIARPKAAGPADDLKSVEAALHRILEKPAEQKVSTIISAAFMILVGLSMPPVLTEPDVQHPAPGPPSLHAAAPGRAVDDPTLHGGVKKGMYTDTVTAAQPSMGWTAIVFHVLAITVASNLGKMFPALCYRKEASWRHRLALAIGMWPRGEVGAGILVLSLSYGIGGPVVTVAMLSLTLNLVLTGGFILVIKKLIGETANTPGNPEALSNV